MTRDEFKQECCLRLAGTLLPENILEHAEALAKGLFGEDPKEYEAAREKELEQKETGYRAKLAARREELNAMPKNYVLVFTVSRYRSWDHCEREARIISSAVRTQQEIAEEYAREIHRSDLRVYPVAEYCFVNEEQAFALLNFNEHTSRRKRTLQYVTNEDEWYRLCKNNGLENKCLDALYRKITQFNQ